MPSLTDLLFSLQPRVTLDVGCGCGEFARTLASGCEKLVCIDASPSLVSRWHDPVPPSNVAFCCMDARRMGFRSSAFPIVFERASLHHAAEWETVLDEMFRVSSAYVLLEEPVDDPRSVAKRNTIKAQDFFLELQHEIGVSHFRHLNPTVLLAAVAQRGIILRYEILRTDDLVQADEYFAVFSRLAGRSRRPRFWESRLQAFLGGLEDGTLSRCDSLIVLAEVRRL